MGRTYLVVRCPHCGNVMVVLASKRFTCRFCGKESSVAGSQVLFTTNDARRAREVAANIKEKARERG